MNQLIKMLPEKLKEEDLLKIPEDWFGIAKSSYRRYVIKAKKEQLPSYNTLMACAIWSLVIRNREFLDKCYNMTKINIPEDISFSISGMALSALGYKEEAMSRIYRAMQLNPCEIYNMALLSEIENLDEKIEFAQKVIDENPQNEDAYRHMAYAYLKKGNSNKALELIKQTLEINKNNCFAREFYGDLFLNKKEYRKALNQYRKAYKGHFMSTALQFRIAQCLYGLGKIRQAKKLINKIKPYLKYSKEFQGNTESIEKLAQKILVS